MGGSGGSSSGAVDYPEYMKTQHETWLTDIASDITTAQAANPYATAAAYDPDCVLAASNYILSVMYSFITAVDYSAGWESFFDTYKDKFDKVMLTNVSAYGFSALFDDTHVSDLVSAYQTTLGAIRDTDLKPAYKVGMQNVNAVMSSAFTIGDALITAQVARDVAKFSADAYLRNEDKLLQYEQLKAQEHSAHNKLLIDQDQLHIEQERMANELGSHNVKGVTDLWDAGVKNYGNLAAMTIDSNRIKIVAKQEEMDKNFEYDKKDALWTLETYKYGGNLLASISGTAVEQDHDISTGRSVLGGVLSGAAAGAALGPVGSLSGAAVAGIGALLGGIGGAL